MIRTSGNLVLPFVIWAPNPPHHEIRSILVMEDGKEVITGGADGNIIIWSIDNQLKCSPKWMLCGHRTTVLNLCLAGTSSSCLTNYFFSHSIQGEMAVWSSSDGKCVEFKVDTRHQHFVFKSHKPSFLDYHLLLCCGNYPHIIVLHATSLAVLFNLASHSKPNWISNFVVISHPNQNQEVVLGLSYSNAVTLWTLDGEEIQGESKYEHESRVIKCSSIVRQVRYCPQAPRQILLVCPFGWQMLDAMNCSTIFNLPNPPKDPLLDGAFLTQDLIIVYGQSGLAYIYKLPTSFTLSGETISTEEFPVQVLCLSPHPSISDSAQSIPSDKFYINGYCCFSGPEQFNDHARFIVAGTADGRLVTWDLTNLFSIKPSNNDNIPIKRPINSNDLQSVWREHNLSTSHWHRFEEFLSQGNKINVKDVQSVEVSKSEFLPPSPLTVTVCIQMLPMLCPRLNDPPLIHPCRLAFGLNTGQIIVLDLVDYLKSIYWDTTSHLASELNSLCLVGHSGTVTCLLHPASVERQQDYLSGQTSNSRQDYQFNPDFLLSGGVDFTVRLWDLDYWRDSCTVKSGSFQECNGAICLAVFHCHASPPVGLVIGPLASMIMHSVAGNPRLLGCVCSFGADGSASLISLKEQKLLLHMVNHSSQPLLSIGWRVFDDFLLLYYADESLAIWDISMGCLDRLEYNQAARDIFEHCQLITEIYHSSATHLSSIPHFQSFISMVLCKIKSTHQSVYYGTLNSSGSAGSACLTSPARLTCMSDAQKLNMNTSNSHPVHLHLIGSTSLWQRNHSTTLEVFYRGPAAFVFHWDVESLVGDILSLNEFSQITMQSLDRCNVSCSTHTMILLQLLLSIVFPWGLDLNADQLARSCCTSQMGLTKRAGYPDAVSQFQISHSLCVGLISRNGCFSLSMPGFLSKLPQNGLKPCSMPSLYSLCSSITTNLLLSSLSLCEAICSLASNTAPTQSQSVDRSSEPYSDLNYSSNNLSNISSKLFVTNFLKLGLFLCDNLLKIWPKLNSHKFTGNNYLDITIFVQKWQNRCLPIRYAARALLFTYLDHLSTQARNHLVKQWSSLLPPFVISSSDQMLKCSNVTSISTGLNGSERQTSITTIPTSRGHFVDGHLGNQIQNSNFSSREDLTEKRSIIHTRASFSRDDSLDTPDVNICAHMNENIGKSALMAFAHISEQNCWWMNLNQYRVSVREHARLQAMALIFLSAIGTRFGSNSRRCHPALAAQDLINCVYVINPSDTNDVSVHLTCCGIVFPHFSTINDEKTILNTCDPSWQIENFHVTEIEIPEGFAYDDYHLARTTCHCLTTLLLSRSPISESADNIPAVNWNQKTSDSSSLSSSMPILAANALICLLTSNTHSSLRRAAIDLLGRGFTVWEPYVEIAQVLNALLLLAKDADQLTGLKRWQTIPDRIDLARTAREALWAIGFTRTKLIALALSLEVRRYGQQINAAASAVTPPSTAINGSSSVPLSQPQRGDSNFPDPYLESNPLPVSSLSKRESTDFGEPRSSITTSSVMVLMASPTVTASLFGSNIMKSSATNQIGDSTSALPNPICPPLFLARNEVLYLFEQLCLRRMHDILTVLPEVVEVVLACLDRTRLKERGLDVAFPALKPFYQVSSHTRLQKVCAGGMNGTLTFFDFKIGRYFVVTGHKGPVSAVRFHIDGRQIATYSLTDNTLKVWQLHTAGFFGMGGQQVKLISSHPVPPLSLPTHSATSELVDYTNFKVWLDWVEPRAVNLITNKGIKRRVVL